MIATVRHPAVAGRFYSGDRDSLLADVHSYLSPPEAPVAALGCVAPHAGYVYSGHVAGAVFARLDVPSQCIVLCPNHTGHGQPLSIMTQGHWETPLGNVAIAEHLAASLVNACPALQEDFEAHRSEHAVEVQLPFLKARQPSLSFVPIALGTSRFESLAAVGDAIANVIARQSERILIVASSDMNHYESDPITRVKDHKAIGRILALDPRGLYDTVMNEHISMCGFGPTIAMLTASKKLGATRAELVKYATSGDISGDRDMVVGYAGLIVS